MPDLSETLLGVGSPPPPPGAPASTEDLSTALLGGATRESVRLDTVIRQGMGQQPDQAARILDLQMKTGLPEDFLLRNLDAVERDTRAADFNAETYRKQNPIVAEWLAEQPARASVALPDVTKLGELEREVKNARIEQVLNFLPPLPEESQLKDIALARLTDLYSPPPTDDQILEEVQLIKDERLKFAQEIAETSKIGLGETLAKKIREDPLSLAPLLPAQVLSGLGHLEKSAYMYFLAKMDEKGLTSPEEKAFILTEALKAQAEAQRGRSVGGLVGEYGTGMIGFGSVIRGTAGVYQATKATAGGLLVRTGEGVVEAAFKRALASAAGVSAQIVAGRGPQYLAAGFERITPTGELVPDAQGNISYVVQKGTGESVAVGFSKAFIQEFGEFATEGLGGTKAFRLIDDKVNRLLFGVFTRAVPGGKAEAFGAWLQKAQIQGLVGEMSEEELAKLVDHVGGIAPYRLPTGDELLAEALTFGAPGAIRATLSHVGEAHLAQANAERMKRMGQVVKGVELKDRAPAAMLNLADRLTKDSEAETVYLDPKVWKSYFEGKGGDPRAEAAVLLGASDAYDEAVKTDSVMPIPTSKYMLSIAATEHGAFFAEEIKVSPDAMNGREAKEYFQGLKKTEAEKEIARGAKEAEQAWAESDAGELYRDIWKMGISKSGMDPAAWQGANLPPSLFREGGISIEEPGAMSAVAERFLEGKFGPQDTWKGVKGAQAFKALIEASRKPSKADFEAQATEAMTGGRRFIEPQVLAPDVSRVLDELEATNGQSLYEAFGADWRTNPDVIAAAKTSSVERIKARRAVSFQIAKTEESKLVAAGRSSAEARAQAVITAHDVMRRSQIMQVDPANLYQRDNPVIVQDFPEAPKGAKLEAPYEYPQEAPELPPSVREARRARRGRLRPDEPDLFTTGPLQGQPATYSTRTSLVSEVERTIGARTVETEEDAARALAYLGRGAVERFDALITDDAGKPLAVVGAFKGGVNSSSVYAATILSEAFDVPGAARIWFAHNHPSGKAEFSDEDLAVHKRLSEAFRGSAIKPMGHVLIAGSEVEGKQEYVFESSESIGSYTYKKGTVGLSILKAKVPVVERSITERNTLGPAIMNSTTAIDAAAALSGGKPGIILANNRALPIAFVPVDPAEIGKLRTEGRMDALYRAIAIASPAQSFIVTQGKIELAEAMNLAGLLNNAGAVTMDVVVSNPEGQAFSMKREGYDFARHLTFEQPPIERIRGPQDIGEAPRRPVETPKRKPGEDPQAFKKRLAEEIQVSRGATVPLVFSADAVAAMSQYADKRAGFDVEAGKTVGFDRVARPVSGQKLWEDMTPDERMAEFREAVLSDLEIAVKEADRPIDYLLDRALDPLDPMRGVYQMILKANGATIREGAIKLPPALEGARQSELTVSPQKSLEALVGTAKTFEQPAFHGSPHEFEEFSLTKIGTGEGAQAYGWGLYFAGKKDVADYYRKALTRQPEAVVVLGDGTRLTRETLSEDTLQAAARLQAVKEMRPDFQPWAVEREALRQAAYDKPAVKAEIERLHKIGSKLIYTRPSGRLYKVEIPEDTAYIDLDKPLSEQSEQIKTAIDKSDILSGIVAKLKAGEGQDLYEAVQHLALTYDNNPINKIFREAGKGRPQQEAASRYLSQLGIAGLKYADQSSRNKEGAEWKVTWEGGGTPTAFATKAEAERFLEERRKFGALKVVHDLITYNYVVFDDKLVKILEFEQGSRGAIRFPAGEAPQLRLSKGADASTYRHEMTHYRVEVMARDVAELATRDALSLTPEQKVYMQDAATLAEFVGAPNLDALTVEQHEKIATAGEVYFLTGKAPSKGLRGVFWRLKQWMVKVYADQRALGVELSKEVTAVFDRWHASQDEIDAVREEDGLDPLFDDAMALGMNEKDALAYAEALSAAKQAAEEELTGKIMAQAKREEENWYQEKRSEIRRQLEVDALKQPVYRALDALKRREAPAGEPMLKLSREAVVEFYGEDWLGKLPKGIFGEDGLHPDEVAEHTGFPSGLDLLTAIRDAEPLEKFLDGAADAQMKQLYPDILSDPAKLKAEAIKAVHSEKQSLFLRKELEHLISDNFATFKRLSRKIIGKIPTPDTLKEDAEKVVNARKIRDNTPIVYQRAARAAAKESLEAFLKGDFQAAFDAKLRELVNNERYRVAADARADVAAFLAETRKMFRPDADIAKTRDVDLVKAAQAILGKFGIGPERADVAEYMAQVQRLDPELAANLQNVIVDATVGATDYKDATYTSFVSMQQAVKALWEMSRRSRQIEIEGKIMDRNEVRDLLSAKVKAIGQPYARLGYDQAATKWEKAKIGLMGMRASLRRTESWVDAMDGAKPGGDFRRFIWTPISDAISRYREEKVAHMQKYLDLVKPIEKSITPTRIPAEEIGYTFRDKAELLGALSHRGNESNLSKLLRGRGWGSVRDDGSLDTSKWDALEARLQREGILTKADYDFTQGVWDLLETMKPAAWKAHKEMYGYYPAEVVANEFNTPFGKYRGGYVPAMVDTFISQEAQARAEREALEKSGNSFMFPTTGRGFTKTRSQGFAAPLTMDLRFLPIHMDKVLRFSHIEPRVKDVGRLLMKGGLRDAINDFDPTIAGDMLIPWLQRSAQQRISQKTQGRGGEAFDTVCAAIRARTGMQIMVGNMVNTLQQFTGISISATKVRPAHLRDALWAYVRAPKATADSVTEKSLYMRTRLTSHATEIRTTLDELLLNPNAYQKARAFTDQHGHILQRGTQGIVDTITWMGAYDQATARGASETEAVHEADSTVRLTQGSGAPEDISRFEAGTPFQRLFTMFTGYFNMQANLLGSEFSANAREMGLRKGAGRMLYIYTMGFMIPAVLSEILVVAAHGGPEDEDDDGYMNDWLQLFIGAQFRTAAAMVPGGGLLARVTVARFNDKRYDDRITTSPAISTIENAVNAPNSVYEAIAENGKSSRAIKDTLSLLGLLTGLPLAPIGRPVGYLADVAEGEREPEGAVDVATGVLTGYGTGKR